MWIGYSGFGNLADYSASVFPVTKVIPEVDVAIEAHEFRSEIDKDTYEACALLSAVARASSADPCR